MANITAKKMGMTQIWKNDKVIPVTILKVEEEASLEEGAVVVVRGITKGKGFQGVVKRHGFRGGPKSHGQKHSLRAPGSIGATAPQRVIPGRRMAGRMGSDRKTLKNVRIEGINKEERTLFVKGPVPGARGSKVEIIIMDQHE
ncbi:MAG: 50S ribosomal protein L3 [Nanoarchaeota archaeon]|nr:50S ribosomal protein L3 [Nanoarchaeota archaeon]